MSNSKRRGIRIGHYRITPLGIGTIAALVIIIAAVPILLSLNGGADDNEVQQIASLTPAPTATAEAVATEKPTAAPEATDIPEATAVPKPETRRATIRVLGEIAMENDLLKSAYNQKDKTFDFSPMFSEIADIIGNADYTIADVEGTLGDTQGASGAAGKMLTPSVLAQNLADVGVDMLMLGNDHIMDGGFNELKATIKKVKAAGLDHIGAYANEKDKARPFVKEINGIKVGFVSYCESLNVGGDIPAVNLIASSNAVSDIKAVKKAGAEVVIAIVNWGKMFSHMPNDSQVQIAQVLTVAGADVILGYNPHAVQPVQWLETKINGKSYRALCLGAPGNFLSNQRATGTDCGIVFEFTLKEQKDGSVSVVSPKYIPTYVLRYKKSNGLYQYRTVAIGRYTGESAQDLPTGMSSTDVQYMKKLSSAIKQVMGTKVASMISE